MQHAPVVHLRIMLHHLPQAAEAAVVHIRSGERDVPQAGHAELAEVALLQLDVLGADGVAARRVVVEAAEQVVRARLQLLDALEPAGIDATLGADARIGKFAVGEMRAEVASAAVALAYKNGEAPL